MLPYFITVRNGPAEYLDVVQAGNEGVIRARYADADYFFRADTARPLDAFTPRLATLTFQEKLGSMLDKVHRVERRCPRSAALLGLDEEERATTEQAAAGLFKSDLATQMVVELTSLQGIMGREYARLSGEPRRWRMPSTSTTCRASRATCCPHRSPASCSASPTGSIRWSACSRWAWRRRAPRTRSACAAMRSGWCRRWRAASSRSTCGRRWQRRPHSMPVPVSERSWQTC